MSNCITKYNRQVVVEPLECEWCAKLFNPKAGNKEIRREARFCNKTCQNQYQKHHKGFKPD